LLSDQKTINEDHFAFLYDRFSQGESPIILQQAANTIAKANLSDEQLMHLTSEVLPGIDPFVLPRLLPAYDGGSNPEIGNQLITYLSTLPSLDNFTETYLRELFSNYPDDLQPRLGELLEKLSLARKERIQRITALEQSLGNGSEERGRALYFGKAICSTCHTVREGGGALGPDLTSIQKDRSVHDIIEAVVYPSVSFVREYETYKITTNTSEYKGIIKEQTPEMVLLETAPETSVRIPASDIQSIEQVEVSMMPQGLDQLLTEDEFSDLLAYLMAKDLEY
jgi:putative heme-binding domain-containing protein